LFSEPQTIIAHGPVEQSSVLKTLTVYRQLMGRRFLLYLNTWLNNLPNSTKAAESVVIFKKQLKAYIIYYLYIYIYLYTKKKKKNVHVLS